MGRWRARDARLSSADPLAGATGEPTPPTNPPFAPPAGFAILRLPASWLDRILVAIAVTLSAWIVGGVAVTLVGRGHL